MEDTPMEQNSGSVGESPERSLPVLPLDEVVRRGAQRLLQQALDVEVELFLERYQYIMNDDGHRQVVRNGYRPERKIVTGAGQVDVKTPRVDDRVLERHRETRFTSNLIPPYLRRTKHIEELIPVLYLKGISTGDFTEALEAILGKDVVGLSAENIVRLKQIWQKDYETWRKRDLSGTEYVYIWADGIYFNVRMDTDRQCLLVIIGAKPDGKKELIVVEDGFRESKESWQVPIRDVKRRGLKIDPKLAIGDGALGFWAALEEECPRTQQQICWVHSVPRRAQAKEVKRPSTGNTLKPVSLGQMVAA
jgi:putative transposase